MSKKQVKNQTVLDVFKSCTNKSRLGALAELIEHSKVFNSVLVKKLKTEPTLLTHHMGNLKDLNIVTTEQEGKQVYYKFTSPKIKSKTKAFLKAAENLFIALELG